MYLKCYLKSRNWSAPRLVLGRCAAGSSIKPRNACSIWNRKVSLSSLTPQRPPMILFWWSGWSRIVWNLLLWLLINSKTADCSRTVKTESKSLENIQSTWRSKMERNLHTRGYNWLKCERGPVSDVPKIKDKNELVVPYLASFGIANLETLQMSKMGSLQAITHREVIDWGWWSS